MAELAALLEDRRDVLRERDHRIGIRRIERESDAAPSGNARNGLVLQPEQGQDGQRRRTGPNAPP
jgi:hypothetical protein